MPLFDSAERFRGTTCNKRSPALKWNTEVAVISLSIYWVSAWLISMEIRSLILSRAAMSQAPLMSTMMTPQIYINYILYRWALAKRKCWQCTFLPTVDLLKLYNIENMLKCLLWWSLRIVWLSLGTKTLVFWLQILSFVATNMAEKHPDALSEISNGFTITPSQSWH